LTVPILLQHQNPTRPQRLGQRPPAPREFSGLKDAEAAHDNTAYAQYPKLTEPEIKALVVDDKWLARLDADIHGEMDRISQALSQRVRTLAERYEFPMPELADRVAKLEAKVTA
jgi:type I restriction enzyme M protein